MSSTKEEPPEWGSKSLLIANAEPIKELDESPNSAIKESSNINNEVQLEQKNNEEIPLLIHDSANEFLNECSQEVIESSSIEIEQTTLEPTIKTLNESVCTFFSDSTNFDTMINVQQVLEDKKDECDILNRNIDCSLIQPIHVDIQQDATVHEQLCAAQEIVPYEENMQAELQYHPYAQGGELVMVSQQTDCDLYQPINLTELDVPSCDEINQPVQYAQLTFQYATQPPLPPPASSNSMHPCALQFAVNQGDPGGSQYPLICTCVPEYDPYNNSHWNASSSYAYAYPSGPHPQSSSPQYITLATYNTSTCEPSCADVQYENVLHNQALIQPPPPPPSPQESHQAVSSSCSSATGDKIFSQRFEANHTTVVDRTKSSNNAAAHQLNLISLNAENSSFLKFPQKLWNIVNNCRTEAICWGRNGDSILIHYEKFQQEYLSEKKNIFKTLNINSFIRQLNLYGFKKVVNLKNKRAHAHHEFRHLNFRRKRDDLLTFVNRNYHSSGSKNSDIHKHAEDQTKGRTHSMESGQSKLISIRELEKSKKQLELRSSTRLRNEGRGTNDEDKKLEEGCSVSTSKIVYLNQLHPSKMRSAN